MNIFKNIAHKAAQQGLTPAISRQIGGLIVGCTVLGMMLIPELALAGQSITLQSGKTATVIAGNINNSIGGITTVITSLAYIGAVGFGFVGILKWKAHSEQPDRVALKIPITYMVIAAMCAALPEVIGTGIASIFGGSANLVQSPL
jgi:hypothetical protein